MADPGPGRLVEPTIEDAELVATWAGTAADVVMFSGQNLRHPLSGAQLLAVAAEQGRITRVLRDEGRAVAFGSLLVTGSDARLGWVITDPGRRGRGWGRRLVTALVDLARSDDRLLTASLAVYEHNVAARALYADLGFVESGERRRTRVADADWVSRTLAVPLRPR